MCEHSTTRKFVTLYQGGYVHTMLRCQSCHLLMEVRGCSAFWHLDAAESLVLLWDVVAQIQRTQEAALTPKVNY